MTLANHVRTLGRGPGRSRSLTMDEADDAMQLVLSGTAAPEAVGALLMLLRMKGETAQEIAGLSQAARDTIPALPTVDLDWPSYAAGRTRGLPWFLLSARLVTQAGHRVLLHGWNGPDGAVRAGLAAAGIPQVHGADGAARALDTHGIAYLPLGRLSAPLFGLLQMREVLGLRSCINTVCWMLAPGRAGVSVQGVFHPSYLLLQADAAQVLGWCALSVIKGGGGEFERHPGKPAAVFGLRSGAVWDTVLAPLTPTSRGLADAPIPATSLAGLWAGTAHDAFAEAVVIGTGCPGIDASLHALARAARCPVNVVDQPDLCELTTPSIIDRDPIVIAIGSEGTAPVLTRDIKTKIEALPPRNIGGLAALAGWLRPSVAARVPRENRRALWAWVFKGAARDAWTCGEERAVAKTIKATIENGGPPKDTASGRIALVGAGPGACDLLMLRAVEYLQEADVIFYDRLVDPDVLELARRDAARVYVRKVVGAHDWPQDRITAAIVAEARKGRRVVRLKSRDPMVFGRAGEEIAAATAAGIPCDIVPGVTAACAAAARLGRSLTERDVADTLVFATGSGSANDPLPDCTRLSGPGTTSAFYMAARQADRLSTGLMANGLPASAPVDVLVNVSKQNEQHFVTTVGTLASDIDRHDIDGCAILLITWPKAAASKGAHVTQAADTTSSGAVRLVSLSPIS